MEWMTLSGNIPCVALISLGANYGDKYYISDECLYFLNEILDKLNGEEADRQFRRALSFMDIINKDLIPILVEVKDQPAVLRSTIKVLVGLTIPVECLTSTESEVPQQVTHELNHLVYNAKEAFLEAKATRAILDHLFPLVEKQPLTSEDCELVNDCLLLLRNILHAPERPGDNLRKEKCGHSHLTGQPDLLTTAGKERANGTPTFPSLGHLQTSQQNTLIWNLFNQGLDKLILTLLNSEQKKEWVVSIVQLIALFYKDQHVETMQKLISSLMVSTPTDSSEDDESNTSPPGSGDRPVSPQILTTSSSDPPSDSSDSALPSEAASLSQQTVTGGGEIQDPELCAGMKAANKITTTSAIQTKLEDNSLAGTSCLDSVNSVALSSSSGVASETAFEASDDKAAEFKVKPKDVKRRSNCMKNTRTCKTEAAFASGSTTSSEDLRRCTKRPLIATNKLRSAAGNADREKRRKSMAKRSCSVSRKKSRTFGHHIPTDEDISQILKDFTVDFLLKEGYDNLVGQLHQLFLEKSALPLDKSHFLWLITYFLTFASQLELDIKHVKNVLSTEILCFITWEALCEAEMLELQSMNESSDLKPNLRRLHLAVTAIREFLQALETYSRLTNHKEDDRQQLQNLRSTLPMMKDLRQLFLLLIRHFNPILQSPRYLRDVITTNHVLLLSLERSVTTRDFVVQDHLLQFCSRAVLKQYGLALEDYKTNGQFVNDCILTVLHHIGTDLGNAELLCEPVILRAFSRICEDEFEMCDDWVDLIEFVCQRFLRNFQHDSSDFSSDYKPKLTSEDSSGSDQDMEPVSQQQQNQQTNQPSYPQPVDNKTQEMVEEPVFYDVKRLIQRLMESGMQQQVLWLQQQLLTLCSVKLKASKKPVAEEIVASMSQLAEESCPVIPWNDVQAAALRTEAFVLLLHRLGLVPEHSTGIFPRIPFDWDCDTLYSVALELGRVTQDSVNFELSLVKKVQIPEPAETDGIQSGGASHWTPPYLGPGPSTSLSIMPYHWLHWVEQSGSLFRSAEKTSGSLSNSNHSHRPMDSVSTTSSLEVHKTDSSDYEEMEDVAPQSIEPMEDCSLNLEENVLT